MRLVILEPVGSRSRLLSRTREVSACAIEGGMETIVCAERGGPRFKEQLERERGARGIHLMPVVLAGLEFRDACCWKMSTSILPGIWSC